MDLQQLWQTVLGEVEVNISRPNFLTWFKDTEIQSKKDGIVTISAPNGFTKEWLENKYNKILLKSLRNNSPDIKEIKFIINTQNRTKKQPEVNTENYQYQEETENDQLNFQSFNINKETNLNHKYTFDNFIIGSFNELAQAAGRAIVKNPGTLYNPLFIYSNVGLGKTHLLQAVGNEIIKRHPSKKIKYLNSEKYTSELVDAISKRGMESFKNKYQKIDTLIIDDIQFIAGKEKTQEEFFHTFNALYQKNKQIIISSDRPPQSISTLEERLRSRFEGGMIADISQPDLETRIAILKSKTQERKIKLPEEAYSYIASHIQKNIRELEGALNRIVAITKMQETEPTMETINQVFSHIINQPKKITNHKKIIKTVAEFYDINSEEMINQSRKREFVKPRQVAMYLLKKESQNSYPSIGEKLGGRDHTTVMYACQKIEKEIEKDESFKQELNLIKERLHN